MKVCRQSCAALVLALALTMTATATANPFSARTAFSSVSEHKSCLISVEAGELLEFSAVDLERRMGLSSGSLDGITVTALPLPAQGGLFLDGVEVEPYEFVDRPALDRMCFAAGEASGNAVVGLLPKANGGVATNLNIRVLDQANGAPFAEGALLRTGRNIPASGYLQAADPDGDSLSVQVTRPPQKGEVTFKGLAFTYEPYHNKTGPDSFSAYAVDSNGFYSGEVTVSINIDKQKLSFYYTDMVIHPSQYAALMLHESGVYTGQAVGSSYFFQPDEQMTRGEFLMVLITSAGLSETMKPTVNTGLPNDQAIPSHLKRYIKKAVEEGIISPELAFRWDEVPSRAEAVVLTDRAAKIEDVKSYPLTMKDAERLPAWSRQSYKELAAYRMLELYDGYARPDGSLTNAYAADLAWQLYKHTHREK